MFKVGDKVRVKKNVKDIIKARNTAHIRSVEVLGMGDMYAGEIGVVEEVSSCGNYRVFGFYWGEYSLEYPASDSISGYDLLL